MSDSTFIPAFPNHEEDNVALAMEEPIPPVSSTETFPVTALPISRRRRVMFAYTDPEHSKEVFDWALKHVFQEGKDHVILADAYISDPTNPVLTAQKLWEITAGEIDGVELEMKEKKEKELVEMHIENLRLDLTKLQISSQKYVLSVKDPRVKLVEIADATKSEIIIVGRSSPGLVERAIYGYLDDYLIRNCKATVIVVNASK